MYVCFKHNNKQKWLDSSLFLNLCAGVNTECFVMKSNDVMLLFRCLTWPSGDKQNMDLVELRGNARLCVLGCFWGRSIYSDFEA